MPEALASVFATPGFFWLVLTIAVAGIVRGFTGFGTALIFVPVAGQFLPPEVIILVVTVTGVGSAAALLPRAWSRADRGEIGVLVGAAVVTVPLGLWILTQIEVLTVRWVVAGIACITLAAVVSGWQWRGKLGVPGLISIGGAAGLMGGMTGLTGPVVIMFYLANARSAQAVRATTIVFLASLDVVIILYLLAQGRVDLTIVWLGVILSVPYFATSLIGQRLFVPAMEKTYHTAAYVVIGLAVITGMPLFD
ncbi:MAG: sulfite exporter TauE/SafE family protein [Rhodobacteraceae bacterium]|nr:sulfite exporter TauE/SafE family protein [Paracoccaceae bacterium]